MGRCPGPNADERDWRPWPRLRAPPGPAPQIEPLEGPCYGRAFIMSSRRRFVPPPALTLLHDVGMAALSFPLSVWLRVGGLHNLPFLGLGTTMFTACAAAVFVFSGLNRGVWRYASLPDLL